VIAVDDLSKGYSEQILFEKADFFINPKERIGLVGRNGHGKSTLFRMLTGEEQPDGGTIRIPKGYRIGHLSQHINFTQPTVLAEGCLGLPPGCEWDEWKVEKILMGLGFEEKDFQRDPNEFSGGYQLRLNLTKALVAEPDLLLLDEPTNFLDIVSIRWMIEFLREWPSELVVISHDRHFMDAVVTHIMGIHRHRIKKIPGTTGEYYDQIAIEESFYEKGRITEEKKREETAQFINRFRAQATKARQVQSRVKALDRMENRAKLSRIADLSFKFRGLPFPAKVMLHAHSLSFGFEEGKPLFSDIDLTIENHDRICVIGKNGKGKTTFLKVLNGLLPQTSGTIKTHPSLVKGFFEQANTADLNMHNTVEAEILACLEKKSLQEARRLCGIMMFTHDQALKKISVLSGGERARVLLAKLLATPNHLLLLDEPTHHLDMQSGEAMAEAVADFDGAAIVVTHDENFLRDVGATKFVIFHHDRAFVYHGTYDEFLAEIGWDEDAVIQAPLPTVAKAESKEEKKERTARQAKRHAEAKPLQDKLEKLEKQITLLEQNFESETALIAKASIEQNASEITRLAKSLKQLREMIDFGYLELESVTTELDQIKQTWVD